VDSEGLVAFEPGRDGTPQRLGQARQRLAQAMCFRPSGQGRLAGGMVAETAPRRVRDGPRERRRAPRAPGGPGALARRCVGTRDEAARGAALLPAGETLDLVDRIQPDEAEDVPDPGPRLEQSQGVGVVRLRRVDAVPRERGEPRVRGPTQRQVHCHALLPGGSRTPLGNPVAVGCGGQLCPTRGPVIRAVGVLAMRQPCRPRPGAIHPAPEEVTGCPHGGGIDGGLREQAPTAPPGKLVGGDRVGCGLAAMERVHREGVPEDTRDPVVSPQVREPGRRCSGLQRPRPALPDRARWPGETSPDGRSGAGAA
jgi:hypothetical protein